MVDDSPAMREVLPLLIDAALALPYSRQTKLALIAAQRMGV